MASILDALSQGFRGMGAVYSPDVYNTQRQEEQNQLNRQSKDKELLLGVLAKAAESGAISPEVFQQAAQKAGVQGIPQMGPTAATQKTNAELQLNAQRQAMRTQLRDKAFANGNGTEQQTAYAQSLFASGDPELQKEGENLYKVIHEKAASTSPLFKLQTEREALVKQVGPDHPRVKQYDDAIAKASMQSEGQGTQMERALQTLQELQLQVNSGKPLDATQQLAAESAHAILSQQRMQIDPVTNQPMYIQPLTVPSSITVGRGSGGKPVNTVPSLSGGRKPLDAGTEKVFRDIGNGRAQIESLISEFKPEYGGFKSETLANGAIEAGRRGILTQYHDTADFWQRYEQWITDMRAAKFGMTLTGYELQQFNKYRSKPSDSPKIIQSNLKRQIDIVDAAIKRELGATQKSGQNTDQAKALVGVDSVSGAEVKKVKTDEPVLKWEELK